VGPEFSLDVTSDDDGRTIVAVAGELDLARADEFAVAVADALAAGDTVIDLGELEFMDSAGVRAMNTALRLAAEHGHDLVVRAALQPSVAQVLELTGMMALLPVEGSR
jgi:anti-sigma B factor antagonist